MWIERLSLTNFRNYQALTLELNGAPVVLTGANGSGKTNLLEAVSLLAPGQGLRRQAYTELAKADADGNWAVAARLRTRMGSVDIGTGLLPGRSDRSGRIVRIDGEAQSGSGALAEHVEVVWLTPASDGLLTQSGSERRRFLDRLVLCFDPEFRKRAALFERAMRQRNRLLDDGVRDHSRFEGLEMTMAEAGVAIAAGRHDVVNRLAQTIAARRARNGDNSPFPWSTLVLDGTLEREIAQRPALDVEDAYRTALARGRERDRAAGRTLDGPHLTDLLVTHGPKDMPGKRCSTGEQKALLVGIVLAHAELIKAERSGSAPILLLDEIAAHLDVMRRAALFDEIITLGSQAWMTGTDRIAFLGLEGRAQFLDVARGQASILSPSVGHDRGEFVNELN